MKDKGLTIAGFVSRREYMGDIDEGETICWPKGLDKQYSRISK